MEGRGLTAGAKFPGRNKPSERPRSQRRATGFSMSSSRPRNANCLNQTRQHLQRTAPKIGCCKIIARRRICVPAGPRRAYAHGGGAVSSTKSVLLPRRRHHTFPNIFGTIFNCQFSTSECTSATEPAQDSHETRQRHRTVAACPGSNKSQSQTA